MISIKAIVGTVLRSAGMNGFSLLVRSLNTSCVGYDCTAGGSVRRISLSLYLSEVLEQDRGYLFGTPAFVARIDHASMEKEYRILTNS